MKEGDNTMVLIGTKCSGPCERCVAYIEGSCLAGHGDDDFMEITREICDEHLDGTTCWGKKTRRSPRKYRMLLAFRANGYKW